MRATYRPALAIARNHLPPTAAAHANPWRDYYRIPGLDEDEATMAVAATRALLETNQVRPDQVAEIVAADRGAPGWAEVFADALGVPTDRLKTAGAVEVHRFMDEAQAEKVTLYVTAHVARPGSKELERDGVESYATAQLAGSWLQAPGDLEFLAPPHLIEHETYQKLARWEQDAPKEVARGAYLPPGTWARSRDARYRLLAGVCPDGHAAFPPRGLCPHCGKPQEQRPLPARGELATHTVIAPGAGPSEFDPFQDVFGEYAVGVAEFGGVRVPGMICDTPLERLAVGLPVEPVFRRLYAQEGAWRYGVKLRSAR